MKEDIQAIYQRIDKGSSPSQKLRHALYELWRLMTEKKLESSPFEGTYEKFMDWYLEEIKAKIEFVFENDVETIKYHIENLIPID